MQPKLNFINIVLETIRYFSDKYLLTRKKVYKIINYKIQGGLINFPFFYIISYLLNIKDGKKY